MKILEIENSEIAKIECQRPILLSKVMNNIQYEWLYFEITYENQHILCIISLLDPFSIEKNLQQNSPTIYLTWYDNKKIIAYSYAVLSYKDRGNLENKIENWLNGISSNLEIVLPCHSTQKIIHLTLNNPFPKANIDDFSSEGINNCSKKHFWQLLLKSVKVQGSIETIEIPREKFSEFFSRYSLFYDKYLEKLLKNKSPCRLQFKDASYYLDHNAGVEKLSEIKNHWFWWHSEQNGLWEVCYFFPNAKQMFYCHSNASEQAAEILSVETTKIVKNYKYSNFFLQYPALMLSRMFGTILVDFKIESAPFYLRARSLGKVNLTLELLKPKNISKKITQFLIGSRKINSKYFNIELNDFESYLDFFSICKNITKNNGKSFFLASHVLSREQREASYFVYTLCRLIDDATDELVNIPTLDGALQGSCFSNKFLNVLWGKDFLVDAYFLIQIRERISFCLFRNIDLKSTENFIFDARRKINEFYLEKRHFEELIFGQKMDEKFCQPNNFNEFYLYCYRVAGVVGLLMAKMFKTQQSEEAEKAAEHLGIAMQITNILRDIKEDFENGRIYIPKSFCQYYNLNIDEKIFFNGVQNRNIDFIDNLAKRAIKYYQNANQGIKTIPSLRARFCVRLMLAIYGSILGKILLDKQIVFKERAIVSKFERILIFFKVILGFSPLKVAKLNRNFTIDETLIL
ncbi:phytoene/squalene synthase family protein [Fluviispira vulneris]|uniref:phytoene/squalene synthase family protein n=1 Tax=Fluviispira vulneris TaxID=2763012 RepID=UPI0016496A50|nr:phytoene/squalene synthase family protein [Fluviispira vulneris]